MDAHAKKNAELDVLLILLAFLKDKADDGKSIDDVIENIEKAVARKRAA